MTIGQTARMRGPDTRTYTHADLALWNKHSTRTAPEERPVARYQAERYADQDGMLTPPDSGSVGIIEITAGSRQYVLFDADADRIDTLPTWDW